MRFRFAIPSLMAVAVLAPGLAAAAEPLATGARYVAMGSSYAAGPGLGQPADAPPTRCARSVDNYPHQLARKRGLALVDVSCSGAVSGHITGPWRELPAQIDAVDGDTRLVTVTIGGNDLNYMGLLGSYACQAQPAPPAGAPACASVALPSAQAYRDLEASLRQIAVQVRRRAPAARLVFVEYFTVLPGAGVCALTPLSEAQADDLRGLAARLAEITSRVAREAGADVLDTPALSRGHDACSADPWINGYLPAGGGHGDGVSYHPRLAGMTAVANALDRLLGS